MAQFCSACGAQMADGVTTCGACGKGSAASATTPAAAGSLNDNVASLLCYIWVVAILMLLLEPYNKNKLIRFHAFQGLFLWAAWFVGHIVLMIIPVLGWILIPFWFLAIVISGIICAVKAYQGNKFKLPVIGDLADKQASA